MSLVPQDKLVFIDAEVGYCDPYWVKKISILLNKCDVAQPFGYVYRVDNGECRSSNEGLVKSFMMHRLSDEKMVNHGSGLVFAMKRETIRRIGGFDVISSPSEDMWFWFKFIRFDDKGKNTGWLPYQLYMDESGLKTFLPKPPVKCDMTCFHVEHSSKASNRYAAYVYACNRQTFFQKWDVDYDPSSLELPKWRDNGVWTDIRKKTIQSIAELPDKTIGDFLQQKKAASDVIDRVNSEFFGEIAGGRKLVIVTILDGFHGPKDVLEHKAILKENLETEFEYVCISDTEIKGVKTVHRKLKNEFLNCVNAFDPEISNPDDVRLYMSLDTIPVEKFRICSVPEGYIGLLNSRQSMNMQGEWMQYHDGIFLFSGDFSFVFENVTEGKPFDQEREFISGTQCIAFNLHDRGIRVGNVTWFVDVLPAKIPACASYNETICKIHEYHDTMRLYKLPKIVSAFVKRT